MEGLGKLYLVLGALSTKIKAQRTKPLSRIIHNSGSVEPINVNNASHRHNTMAEAAQEIKLFAKWPLEDIEISDISLVDFIAVKGKHATYVAHTAGRYQRKKFRKALVSQYQMLILL